MSRLKIVGHGLLDVIIYGVLGILLYLIMSDINKQHKEKMIVKTDHSLHDNAVKIAKVIQSECKDCSDVDKLLIGSSILNRMDNINFPKSINNVINQPNQYTKSKSYSEHDKQLAVCLLENYFRDCEVIYFFNPKTATNSNFIRKIRRNTLIMKTKHHEYYSI